MASRCTPSLYSLPSRSVWHTGKGPRSAVFAPSKALPVSMSSPHWPRRRLLLFDNPLDAGYDGTRRANSSVGDKWVDYGRGEVSSRVLGGVQRQDWVDQFHLQHERATGWPIHQVDPGIDQP